MENKKDMNKLLLKAEIYEELYNEIDMIYDCAVYCLAGKKSYVKKGASGLRSGVSFGEQEETKTDNNMKDNAEKLYRWMILPQSRLRMFINWQSGGGLPFVSGTHLYGMRCFVSYGNTCHDTSDKKVTSEEFQDAVCKRHEMEQEGHSYKEEKDFM